MQQKKLMQKGLPKRKWDCARPGAVGMQPKAPGKRLKQTDHYRLFKTGENKGDQGDPSALSQRLPHLGRFPDFAHVKPNDRFMKGLRYFGCMGFVKGGVKNACRLRDAFPDQRPGCLEKMFAPSKKPNGIYTRKKGAGSNCLYRYISI